MKKRNCIVIRTLSYEHYVSAPLGIALHRAYSNHDYRQHEIFFPDLRFLSVNRFIQEIELIRWSYDGVLGDARTPFVFYGHPNIREKFSEDLEQYEFEGSKEENTRRAIMNAEKRVLSGSGSDLISCGSAVHGIFLAQELAEAGWYTW